MRGFFSLRGFLTVVADEKIADLLDQHGDERTRKIVAHAGDDYDLAAGDRRGGVSAALDRKKRIVGAMNHQRWHAKMPQRLSARLRGERRHQLARGCFRIVSSVIDFTRQHLL